MSESTTTPAPAAGNTPNSTTPRNVSVGNGGFRGGRGGGGSGGGRGGRGGFMRGR